MSWISLRVHGLSRLDGLDIAEQADGESIHMEAPAASGTQHGELATVAVVAITALALRALSAVLLKHRKGTVISRTVEVVDASGRARKETLHVELTESAPPNEQVLSALEKLLGIVGRRPLENDSVSVGLLCDERHRRSGPRFAQ